MRSQGAQTILEQVQPGHLDQSNPLIEVGVGLAGNNVDLMTGFNQSLAEIADVDALTAPEGVTAVTQKADFQGVLVKPLTYGNDVGNLVPRLL